MKLLREYIRLLLVEARRADKEGVELPSLEDELRSYADQNSWEKPEYYITFTAVNKVGINPGSDYNTPAGIYAYPLFPKTVQQLTSYKGSERLPFATQQPFVSILKASSGANLITTAEFTMGHKHDALERLYTKEAVDRFGLAGTSFEEEVQKVEEAVAEGVHPVTAVMKTSAMYEEATKKARKRSIDIIWLLTKMIAGGRPGAGDKAAAPIGKWNAMLRWLGIDAFYDGGTGLIHKNEKQQAIFLSKGAVDVVKTLPNTLTPEHMRTRAKQTGEW
jgi:hypothetical protein